MKTKFFLVIVMILLTTSCTTREKISLPLSLAEFSENSVDVSVRLERGLNGGILLSAAFTPPEGFHLYGKDIPISGVEELGRATAQEGKPVFLSTSPKKILSRPQSSNLVKEYNLLRTLGYGEPKLVDPTIDLWVMTKP